jgi:hypothetical protein
MNFKKHLVLILLLLIIGGAFIVRLYRIDNPIADWHSWRQADTSAVSRNFVKDGFDLLHPHMDNVSNVQSGLDNPHGYFFVEFPIYNTLQAGAYMLFPFFTIEVWGRLISIFASLASIVFLYLLVSRHSNKSIGLFAAFFYAFLPYNIYYNRTILPETITVMAILGGIYFFDRWITATKEDKHKRFYYFLSFFFTACAFLLKAYALFFTLPFVYLAWKHFRWSLFKKWQLWFFALFSVAPLFAWRVWMMQYPEGIPSNVWLFNGNGIRFRPSFFRWIFYERLTILISGYFGMILLLLGVIRLKKIKDFLFFVSFIASSLVYLFTIATGNVQHDYYQVLIMPTVAMLFAIGSYYLYHFSIKHIPVGRVLLIGFIILALFFSWVRVRDYFNINNQSMLAAGKAVDQLTPKDAMIVVPYVGDSSFLYQTKRKGWASLQDPIPVLIEKGADYLVLLDPGPKGVGFGREYKAIAETSQYIIFDLHKPLLPNK